TKPRPQSNMFREYVTLLIMYLGNLFQNCPLSVQNLAFWSRRNFWQSLLFQAVHTSLESALRFPAQSLSLCRFLLSPKKRPHRANGIGNYLFPLSNRDVR